jgi:hypothetical protein
MVSDLGKSLNLKEIVADRGFDQPRKEQKKLKKRWKLKRMVIPKKARSLTRTTGTPGSRRPSGNG